MAQATADADGLQQLFRQFISRVDTEMHAKADKHNLKGLVSHDDLMNIIDDLAATWGDQLQVDSCFEFCFDWPHSCI